MLVPSHAAIAGPELIAHYRVFFQTVRDRTTALKREGFFLVATKGHRFRMHPVESRTGAIRLEDPKRGAMWLQLGNKSMLMSQKLGQRLADECQSPDQLTVAEQLKKNPLPSILDKPPAVADGPAPAASAPAMPAAGAASGPAAATGGAPALAGAPEAPAAGTPAASPTTAMPTTATVPPVRPAN